MVRLFLRILLFAFLPFSALAKPAFVQSGEHDNFTRLVTKAPTGKNWRLEQVENVATLHFENYRAGFDTSRVFDFIPRNRITSVKANQNQLSIFLGCDCEVIAFAVKGGHVAIDIISTEENTDAVSPSTPQVRPPILQRSHTPVSEKVPARMIDLPILGRETRGSLKPEEVAILSDVQTNLIRELGSATTRGVLDPVGARSLIRRSTINTGVFADIVKPDEPAPPINNVPKTGNIRISSSMDTPKNTSSPQNVFPDIGFVCPQDGALDLASWGDDRSFDVQISEARLNLYDALDKLNSNAAINLAQLYLYFGFGVEAQQVLNLDPNLSDEHRLLLDISGIIESENINLPNSLRPLIECGGNISLWVALANSDSKYTHVDPAPTLLALNKLPTHLRKILAPRLSDLFLIRGDSESAAAALRSLERLPEALTSAAKFSQANISIDRGDNANGEKQLEGVVDDNSPQSPSALVALINAKLQSGKTISPETAELIEAYAIELKDTTLGSNLQQAHVLSLANLHQFDRALSQIELMAPEAEDPSLAKMRTYFFRELSEQASDIVFLDIVLQQSAANLSQIEPNIRMALASRLLELGFAKSAQDIMQDVPDTPVIETRQILAAQIALALGQPFQAQAELLGLTSEVAQVIRADAKHMTGEHVEASEIYQEANRYDKAVQSAWLAENWRELTKEETPIFGPVSTLQDPEDILSGEPTGMLARTETALAESAAARQALSNLITASNLIP